MELALVIWAITSLNAIGGFLFTVGIVLTFVAGFNAINLVLNKNTEAEAKNIRKYMWRFSIAATIVFAFLTILPTTKTGWMMAGGYVAQTAVQSDSAKKFAKIVDLKLEEVLDEATKQAKIKAGSINEKKE